LAFFAQTKYHVIMTSKQRW